MNKRKASILIIISTIILAVSCSINNTRKGKDMYKVENFKNGKFQNSMSIPAQENTSMWEGMKQMMFGDEIRVPESQLPFQNISFDAINKNSNLQVTWLGHSSSIIKIDNQIIMTDPIFSKRVSPLNFMGPKRFNKELPYNPEDIKKIDVIVISHNHYDHLDKKAIKDLHSKTEKFIVPLGVGNHLRKWGVPESKIEELGWWESTKLTTGLEFVATPAQHFSGRGLFDRAETLWASWVIIGEKEKVYFSGDSAYFDGFKKIGKKYGPFDLTMIENGQYNEAWADVHMFPEQTIQAHIDLKGKVLLPIHWGAFNLSIHDWHEPIDRFIAEAEKKGVTFTTPIIGQNVVLNEKLPNKKWWKNLVKTVETVEPTKSVNQVTSSTILTSSN